MRRTRSRRRPAGRRDYRLEVRLLVLLLAEAKRFRPFEESAQDRRRRVERQVAYLRGGSGGRRERRVAA